MTNDEDAGARAIVPPWHDADRAERVTIALVRHGRTRWNHERRFLGRTDIPLDEVGLAQARELARRIGRPFDRVYASPLARAWQTASALHDAPVPVADLRELEQGELEGLHAPDAIARYPDFFARWAEDPGSTCTPGGESLGACRDRAMAALAHIAGRHAPGELVAAVTHQLVIAAVTCTILGQHLCDWRAHGVGNTCVTVLGWDGRAWAVVARGWDPVAQRFSGPAGA